MQGISTIERHCTGLLIERGVDVEAKGGFGWIALHYAASDGREAVVRLLVENGANIEAMECHEQTALHWAAWNGHELVVQLLLEKGANLTARGKNGWTALNYALGRGHGAATQLLTIATTSRGLTPQPPPLYVPQDNSFLRTQQGSHLMPQTANTMHVPTLGYNPQAYQNPAALGFGPAAPLQNQLHMRQQIVSVGDNQLVFVTQDTEPSTNPGADFALR